jgi:tetratricopeptide (TPR) repeat protein
VLEEHIGEELAEPVRKASLVLPRAPDSETGPVKIWEQPVDILTYAAGAPDPNPVFLEKRVYQGSSGRVYPLPVVDRIETTPAMRSWRAVHLENQYLRLMVLPEIGGRIHVAMNKRTGYDFIYRQNVIKPALVGLAGPWISGGIEFNWPQHHRPATFMPVEIALERRSDGSAIVWCGDHDPMQRMKGMHGVCLHDARAFLEVMVRLHNRTTETRTSLWWANVATHVHERYQSFFPKDVHLVADHARRAVTTYPLSNGLYYGIDYGARAASGIPQDELPAQFVPDGSAAPNNLGWYANIPVPTSYMIANSKGDFSGGYDHARGEGIVAIADHHTQPGKKQWTWGNHEFGYAWDRSLTDSDGPYIELMLGAYTDNQPDFSFLTPGETKTFSQYWYPLAEIGVPDAANLDLALRLERGAGTVTLHLNSTRDREGCVIVLEIAGQPTASWTGDLLVDAPLHLTFDVASNESMVLVIRQGSALLMRYAPKEIEPAEPPEVAEEPLPPSLVRSGDELCLIGLHLEQYRHPTRLPEDYWLEALRRDPGDARCNLAMGRTYRRRGELAKAEQYLRASIARLQQRNQNPADGEPHYELGLTLQLRGQSEKAYDAFFKSTWNAAWAGPAYHRLAEIDCCRGAWVSALDHLDRSLIKSADNLGALGLRALVLRRLGRGDDAAASIDATLRLDALDVWSRFLQDGSRPGDGQACLDLCFDLLRAGFRREAYELLKRAEEPEGKCAPDGSRTLQLYLLASTAAALGLAAEAERIAERARSSETRYVFPHRVEELLLFEEALAREPRDAHAHLFLGNLLYDKRRHSEAIDHWQQAVTLDASLGVAWRNLAIGRYNVQHDEAAALAAFDEARRHSAEHARLLYEQDQLRKRVGQSPQVRLTALEREWHLVLLRDDLAVEAATLLNSLARCQEALTLLLSRQFQPWEGGEGAVLGQYMRAHMLLAIDDLAGNTPQDAATHLLAALHPPATLAEARHVLQNVSALYYWLGVTQTRMGQRAEGVTTLEKAAAYRSDFCGMKVESISASTCWSALAMRELGREADARTTFHAIREHAERLQSGPARIDYFATSLPNMLLFEEDIERRQEIDARFLLAQAAVGLRDSNAELMIHNVLDLDRNHAGAIDLLRMKGS